MGLGTKLIDKNDKDAMGEVQASPTSYTLLARPKDIATALEVQTHQPSRTRGTQILMTSIPRPIA